MYFTEKTGPTRQSNPEEEADQPKMRRSPRSLPEHSLLRRGYNQTLSTLILSKTYPTKGILSPLSRHARLLGWWISFAEKHLRVDPYFQYFSSRFYIDKLSAEICIAKANMVNIEY